MAKKAVFLDRDGTINDDPGYLSDPEKLRLFPRAAEAIAQLKRADFFLVVVSNQSGVGRGMITETALESIHEKLNTLLQAQGGQIDLFQVCTHRPDENCICRKPSGYLLEQAAKEHDLDLSQSIMIGDRLSDLKAGRAAHCNSIVLVRTGHGADVEKKLASEDFSPDFIGNDLFHVVTEFVVK